MKVLKCNVLPIDVNTVKYVKENVTKVLTFVSGVILDKSGQPAKLFMEKVNFTSGDKQVRAFRPFTFNGDLTSKFKVREPVQIMVIFDDFDNVIGCDTSY